MEERQQKLTRLKDYIAELGSLAVAFSGGVDSTFLLAVAKEVLGDKVLAVTAESASFPKRERSEAEEFCKSRGIRHFFVKSEELDIDGFRQNPVNRCYLCKHELFSEILQLAKEQGLENVAEGSNMDDNGDFRPGLTAVRELGICSPLRYAELTKEEIRALSKDMGLPTWSKPSFACLSSRFVYGEEINEKKLSMVDKAEQLLLDLGFRQVRCRIHGSIARIEIGQEEFEKILREDVRSRVDKECKAFGFSYVTLDLKGYRTGSMNETLKQEVRQQGLHEAEKDGRK